MIRIKRAYESPARSDGRRILVERLWPRGMKKESLEADAWMKEVAPSTELRKWFDHRVERWDQFRQRYRDELDANRDAWQSIVDAAKRGTITLLYSAHDTVHNGAVVLRDYLMEQAAEDSRRSARTGASVSSRRPSGATRSRKFKRKGAQMSPKIPRPLKLEHQELHAELVEAMRAGGKTAEAAKAVAKVLHPHFVKEEKFALPPIGLLASLATGKVNRTMASVLEMTDRLRAELPEMLREHKAVVTALKRLTVAAKKEKKPVHARFAEKLILHAKTEEEVLYPAAILVGEYLKFKLGDRFFRGYA